MKDNTDKHLDKLVGKMLNEVPMKSPSMDFTANILSKIEILPPNNAIVYKPLISRNAWFTMGVLVLGSLTYMIFGISLEESSWFKYLDFDKIPNIEFPNVFSKITISKTFMYSIVIFAVMLFVQIPLLKNYIDKRLEY